MIRLGEFVGHFDDEIRGVRRFSSGDADGHDEHLLRLADDDVSAAIKTDHSGICRRFHAVGFLSAAETFRNVGARIIGQLEDFTDALRTI